MPNITTNTQANIFYKARIAASAHNKFLSSREGAADIMSIDRGRLYRIENDKADPYPEEVNVMADIYEAPHLKNHYCNRYCPIGGCVPEVETVNLDRITVQAVSVLRRVGGIKDDLLDITEDGVIDEAERPVLENIISLLDELNRITANLRNWVEVHGKE